MLKAAIPVLHVTSAAAAVQFYCECLGFTQATPGCSLVVIHMDIA